MKKIMVIILSCLLLTGCAAGVPSVSDMTTPSPSTEPVLSPSPSPREPSPSPEVSPIVFDPMLADTLMSTGNNRRVKDVLERARNGEPVNIACMGGSVTEGYLTEPENNYVSVFGKMFGDTYGDNVRYVNAGMGGTNSAVGWARYERDVTEALGGNPDIFVIEYAINDFEDKYITKGAAYESMVRHVLSLPNRPAVILLFCMNLDLGNMQETYIPLGTAYGLPMITMEGIASHVDSGDIAAEDYFMDDHDHPNDSGHIITAESLMYCLDVMDKEPLSEEDPALPAVPVIEGGADYQEMVALCHGGELPPGIMLSEGSFTEDDGNTMTFWFDDTPKYPTNWKHVKTSNEPFVIEANCKNMLLVYKSSHVSGNAEVYLDGEPLKTVDGRSGGGWDNAVAVLLFNDEVPADHRLEIKMAPGHEGRDFTILAVGVS